MTLTVGIPTEVKTDERRVAFTEFYTGYRASVRQRDELIVAVEIPKQSGAQCGICTPGMILAAIALGPNPSLKQIKEGLTGNLCRCTGYEAIYRAIQSVNANRH